MDGGAHPRIELLVDPGGLQRTAHPAQLSYGDHGKDSRNQGRREGEAEHAQTDQPGDEQHGAADRSRTADIQAFFHEANIEDVEQRTDGVQNDVVPIKTSCKGARPATVKAGVSLVTA
jgi:hypothetical protein